MKQVFLRTVLVGLAVGVASRGQHGRNRFGSRVKTWGSWQSAKAMHSLLVTQIRLALTPRDDELSRPDVLLQTLMRGAEVAHSDHPSSTDLVEKQDLQERLPPLILRRTAYLLSAYSESCRDMDSESCRKMYSETCRTPAPDLHP